MVREKRGDEAAAPAFLLILNRLVGRQRPHKLILGSRRSHARLSNNGAAVLAGIKAGRDIHIPAERLCRAENRAAPGGHFNPQTDVSKLRDGVHLVSPVPLTEADVGTIDATAVKNQDAVAGAIAAGKLEGIKSVFHDWFIRFNFSHLVRTLFASKRREKVDVSFCRSGDAAFAVEPEADSARCYIQQFRQCYRRQAKGGHRIFKFVLIHANNVHFNEHCVKRSLKRLTLSSPSRIVLETEGGSTMKLRRVAVLALCAGAMAKPAIAITNDEACAQMASTAESIMRARQNGIAMQKVLEVASGSKSAAVKDGFRTIIMMAYDQPRFSTQENKQRAIDDFRDEMQLYCMKLPK